jgi:hypothetical protein
MRRTARLNRKLHGCPVVCKGYWQSVEEGQWEMQLERKARA